ncbi:MAG TPA: hypothetical protein VFV22_00945, partial [Candidatus Paceibacterota bacterium]|nr:hypothetical protein [Candidatus Paceibacterota bacterium]
KKCSATMQRAPKARAETKGRDASHPDPFLFISASYIPIVIRLLKCVLFGSIVGFKIYRNPCPRLAQLARAFD